MRVRVIVGEGERDDNSGTDYTRRGAEQLAANGVAVKLLATPFPHCKVVVADGNRAIVGSLNISTASLDNNRELAIAVNDQAIARRITDTFERDWRASASLGQ